MNVLCKLGEKCLGRDHDVGVIIPDANVAYAIIAKYRKLLQNNKISVDIIIIANTA